MQGKLMILRKEHHQTQDDLAKFLGISKGSYKNKETGKTEFTMSEFYKLSKLYGVKMDEIFTPRKTAG